jgi:RimJ/RimL family protein N-acetyltransferase
MICARRFTSTIGFASAAVGQVIEKARANLELWRIESTVRAANPASARVLTGA